MLTLLLRDTTIPGKEKTMKMTMTDKTRMMTVSYQLLSVLWFIIAGLQYRDCGRLDNVLPAIFCGVVWSCLANGAGKRLAADGEK